MANLTGQQIKDTYPGLLNLNIATTGITSTAQVITDGLGNNTGTLIGTNMLFNPSIAGMNMKGVIPDNNGPGFNSSASVPPTGNTNNNVYFFPFYDLGYLSYSAITTVLTTATSSSDVMNMYIYNSQYLTGGYGVMPYQQIYSGTTLPTTGGLNVGRTTSLTGTTSFSGSGPGIYYLAVNITNAGVTPTFRYGAAGTAQNSILLMMGAFFGATQGAGTTLLSAGSSKANFATPVNLNNGVKATYTSSDITTGYSTVSVPVMGFVLNTVR